MCRRGRSALPTLDTFRGLSHGRTPCSRALTILLVTRVDDLAEFIECYNPKNRHKRKATWDADKNPEGRRRRFSYDELNARDKTSLDIFWLKDKSLTDLDNLPEPDTLAEEIIENLKSGLDSFRAVLAGLRKAG